jgi:hypothetical protein
MLFLALFTTYCYLLRNSTIADLDMDQEATKQITAYSDNFRLFCTLNSSISTGPDYTTYIDII